MPDKDSPAWVLYSPARTLVRPAHRFYLSPLVAEQVASQNLLWVVDVIAREISDTGAIENPRPVNFQSPQLWRIESHNPELLNSYGHLAAYYPDDGPLLYSEGVFLFHDKDHHPANGYPQVTWTVFRGDDGGPDWWYIVQEAEYCEWISGQKGGGNG